MNAGKKRGKKPLTNYVLETLRQTGEREPDVDRGALVLRLVLQLRFCQRRPAQTGRGHGTASASCTDRERSWYCQRCPAQTGHGTASASCTDRERSWYFCQRRPAQTGRGHGTSASAVLHREGEVMVLPAPPRTDRERSWYCQRVLHRQGEVMVNTSASASSTDRERSWYCQRILHREVMVLPAPPRTDRERSW